MLEDHVILRGDEAWLVDEDDQELLARPFEAIYYEDFDYVDDDWNRGIVHYEDNGKNGYIREDGVIITEAVYESGSMFLDEKALVEMDGEEFEIDGNGNIVGE